MNLSRIDSATGIIHSAGVKTGRGNLSAVKAEIRGLLEISKPSLMVSFRPMVEPVLIHEEVL